MCEYITESVIQSFSKYFLSCCCVSGSKLYVQGDTQIKQDLYHNCLQPRRACEVLTMITGMPDNLGECPKVT